MTMFDRNDDRALTRREFRVSRFEFRVSGHGRAKLPLSHRSNSTHRSAGLPIRGAFLLPACSRPRRQALSFVVSWLRPVLRNGFVYCASRVTRTLGWFFAFTDCPPRPSTRCRDTPKAA